MTRFLASALVCGLAARALAQSFGEPVDMGRVEYAAITEASGLAASRKNPGVLWTHNDSGGETALYAMDTHGRHLGVYRLAGVALRDWEDMAIGPGPEPGEHYLYVGEIGDNNRSYDLKHIYRVLEPTVRTDQDPVDTVLTGVQRLSFRYPDGRHDAETLMVDPVNGDIFVVNKESPSVLYRVSPEAAFFSEPGARVDTLERIVELPFAYAVGGDICPEGNEMLIKTYVGIFYWARGEGESWPEALAKAPTPVPYKLEPQGEAVCWAGDDSGYFTLSEETSWYQAHLYFYPRRQSSAAQRRDAPAPSDFRLEQNCPNPVRTRTEIRYELSRPARVQIAVYDVLGRRVLLLEPGVQSAGPHRLPLMVSQLPAGVYTYVLTANGRLAVGRRMVVVR